MSGVGYCVLVLRVFVACVYFGGFEVEQKDTRKGRKKEGQMEKYKGESKKTRDEGQFVDGSPVEGKEGGINQDGRQETQKEGRKD